MDISFITVATTTITTNIRRKIPRIDIGYTAFLYVMRF
nr:MAG TPA: hypothetical protein [Bacteriophage sp.]